MADDFLSQDEVDALLKGVTGDTEETVADGDTGGSSVRSYNLGTQERIVRGRMPTFELINERFARFLRIGLFNHMHRTVEISVGPIKVQKYSEFVRNLVVPTNLNMVSVKPLRGSSLFIFDPNLVFLVIDNMFGGDGRFHTRVEGRDFTQTEQRMILSLLDVVFSEYQKAWEPVHKIKLEYIRSEMNSQFASIATPAEVVVSTTFTLELSGAAADMHICFPYSMLEPLRDTLNSTMQTDQVSSDRRWVNLLRKQLLDAEVEIVANFGQTQITLGEIVKLKLGDVIPIHVPPKLLVEVDHATLMECHYGQQNGQYALKVEQFLAAESAEIPDSDSLDTTPKESTVESQNG